MILTVIPRSEATRNLWLFEEEIPRFARDDEAPERTRLAVDR
jgi:hypothetical protein